MVEEDQAAGFPFNPACMGTTTVCPTDWTGLLDMRVPVDVDQRGRSPMRPRSCRDRQRGRLGGILVVSSQARSADYDAHWVVKTD